jgi:hypothetical protein
VKLTAQLAQALTNLRGNRDFEVFLEGVKEDEREFLQRCADGDGTALYRAQGGAKALQTLLANFTAAPQTLEKHKTNQRDK